MNFEQMRQEAVQIKNQVTSIADTEELRQLFKLKKDDGRYRFHLARNKNTPADVVLELFKQFSDDVEMLEELIAHPNCTEEMVVNILAKEWKKGTSAGMSKQIFAKNALMNPNCPRAHLIAEIDKMIDGDQFYLRPVFNNPNLPAEIIKKISEIADGDDILKRKIFGHPNTPEALREKFKS